MKLDPQKTALLLMDLQQGILDIYPSAEAVIPAAQRAVEFARTKAFRVIHVGVGFSEGHPEIPQFASPLLRFKQQNLLVRGSASADFHRAVVRSGELIVYKQRVSAFSASQLQIILRAQGVEHLVLLGILTSGVVLSTVRAAFDLDYRITVLSDACFDADPEVHRVLIDKVFPRQATITKVDDFIAEQT